MKDTNSIIKKQSGFRKKINTSAMGKLWSIEDSFLTQTPSQVFFECLLWILKGTCDISCCEFVNKQEWKWWNYSEMIKQTAAKHVKENNWTLRNCRKINKQLSDAFQNKQLIQILSTNSCQIAFNRAGNRLLHGKQSAFCDISKQKGIKGQIEDQQLLIGSNITKWIMNKFCQKRNLSSQAESKVSPMPKKASLHHQNVFIALMEPGIWNLEPQPEQAHNSWPF